MRTRGDWKAGAASATFSVPAGTPMAGYAARSGPSTGTLDPLSISCLALETRESRFTLMAVDLIGVDHAMVEAIERGAGLSVGSLALCASHTHSGPEGILERLHPADATNVDQELRGRFIASCVDVVQQAFESVEEATLSLATVQADGIAANRNTIDGIFDPTVTIISARGAGGSPIATVVHFACHPTILPAASTLISGEYPGALRRHLDPDEWGVVLFVNGAAGDVSTRFTRLSQDRHDVERVGATLARAVERAEPTDVEIWAVFEQGVIRPAVRLRHPDEIQDEISKARLAARRLSRNDLSPAERRIEETRLQGADILERLAGRIETMPAEIAIPWWRLGGLTLIGFPGELFASLGRTLVDAATTRLVFGYTNGYAGYFPNRAAYDAGSYEALASPYAAGSGEELVQAVRSAL